MSDPPNARAPPWRRWTRWTRDAPPQRFRLYPPGALTRAFAHAVWLRDGGRCRGPYCHDASPIALEVAHIDHIVPLSRGGTSHVANLRVLCRRCHVLRADHAHQGMIAAALRAGVIPPDWRALVWED